MEHDEKHGCGEPECDEALAQLYEFLDGELDDAKRSHIEHHLHECSPCLEAYDFQHDLKRIIAEKCRDSVPEALRARIAEALNAEPLSAEPPVL